MTKKKTIGRARKTKVKREATLLSEELSIGKI